MLKLISYNNSRGGSEEALLILSGELIEIRHGDSFKFISIMSSSMILSISSRLHLKLKFLMPVRLGFYFPAIGCY